MMNYPYRLFKLIGLKWKENTSQGFAFVIVWPWLATYRSPGRAPSRYNEEQHASIREYQRKGYYHESIHAIQMWEFGPFFFMWYLIYYLNFAVNWITNGCNAYKAYKDVGYEIEAYECQHKGLIYLEKRKPFNWIKYIFSKNHKYTGTRRKLWQQ